MVMRSAAHLLGERSTLMWGHPVLVENRAGGNGIIGTDAVAKVTADGHTLACTSIVHAVNAPLYRTPYDVLNDAPAVTILFSAAGAGAGDRSEPAQSPTCRN
jgi:tripartite-type tricarboxylate transporter receptor subunit TctC